MWTDSPTTAGAVVPDGRERVSAFIAEARERLAFAAFIAEVDGVPVGSASCQLHLTPYPNVLEPGYRRYGYIWGVYVELDWRRRGLARQLTEATLTYLRDLACTRVILNASSCRRTATATLAPREASSRATSAPVPVLPPVIRTTLPYIPWLMLPPSPSGAD